MGRYAVVLVFCLLAFNAVAQTGGYIKGTWKGILRDSLSAFEYTLQVDNVMGGKIFGTSISESSTFYCETKFLGTIKNAKLTIYEAEIVKTNYKNKNEICLLALNISLSNGILTGRFRPINNSSNCLSGSVRLELVNHPVEMPVNIPKTGIETVAVPGTNSSATANSVMSEKRIRIPEKNESPELADHSRTLSMIKEIKIDAEEAEITLYDNGVIDGDSITLVDNNSAVFRKALLTTQPLRYSINNRNGTEHRIAFFADNLGSIPPNTGLMIITANKQRWEVNFSSDYSRTSFVKLILQAKQ